MTSIEETFKILTPNKLIEKLEKRINLVSRQHDITGRKSFFGIWLQKGYKISKISNIELRTNEASKLPDLNAIIEFGHQSDNLSYEGLLLATHKQLPFWCYWSEIYTEIDEPQYNIRWNTYIPESVVKVIALKQKDNSWIVKRSDHIHRFGKHRLANINPEPFLRSIPSSLIVKEEYSSSILYPERRLCDKLRSPVYKIISRLLKQ